MDNNINNEELEVYIPEYKPNKYKKTTGVTKIISMVLLCLMVLGIAILVISVLVNKDAYMADVNGVPKLDTSFIIIVAGMIISGFGIPSLLFFVLSKRLKQANAVFAEEDEKKRLEKHLEFKEQAEVAAEIHRVAAAKSLMDNFKK